MFQQEPAKKSEATHQYEAPVLIDLEEYTGCQSHCSTGGSAVNAPKTPPA